MNAILKELAGGDRRSIGKANEVVAEVLATPELFGDAFSGIFEADPVVRMRAADVVEKVSAQRPELLRKYKRPLLVRAALIEQNEVRWHVAQMIPRLELNKRDMAAVRAILDTYLKTTSSNIVRVMSLQALADLALAGKLDREDVARDIERYAALVGTPSVKTRARRLLNLLYRRANR